MKTCKVFGIGMHKTGTTSLGDALNILGYQVCGPILVRDPQVSRKVNTVPFELLEHYDAFQDVPWCVLFRELDKACPNSKFILTVRPEDEWICSAVKHFGQRRPPIREWIYGAGRGNPEGNEAFHLDHYRRHNREVLEYFADRPDDLLVLRVAEGEGWSKLCPFLGLELPQKPFPKSNTVKDRGLGLRTRRWITARIKGRWRRLIGSER